MALGVAANCAVLLQGFISFPVFLGAVRGLTVRFGAVLQMLVSRVLFLVVAVGVTPGEVLGSGQQTLVVVLVFSLRASALVRLMVEIVLAVVLAVAGSLIIGVLLGAGPVTSVGNRDGINRWPHQKKTCVYVYSLQTEPHCDRPVILLAALRALVLPLIRRSEAAQGVAVLVPQWVGLSGRSSSLLVHVAVASLIRTRAVQVLLVHHGFHHACATHGAV